MRLFLTLFMVLFFSLPARADQLADGQAAYDRGNCSDALKLLQPLADQGNAEAQYRIGQMYFMEAEAAQDNGLSVKAKCQLGTALFDYAEALKWLKKAAEQKNWKADYSIGEIYSMAATGIPQNFSEAAKWYSAAVKLVTPLAEEGDSYAQYMLGVMYNGGDGVELSYREAMKWYRKAAEQGNADAEYRIGLLYWGNWGDFQYDETEQRKWWSKAAQQGHHWAQEHLGELDYKQEIYMSSYFWFRIAGSKSGQRKAGRNLSAEEKSVVEDRVQDWRPITAPAAASTPASK